MNSNQMNISIIIDKYPIIKDIKNMFNDFHDTMFSKDEGENWDIENVLVDDEPGGDTGYPSSVVLKDGNILTVYYGRLPGKRNAVIKQVIWKYSE